MSKCLSKTQRQGIAAERKIAAEQQERLWEARMDKQVELDAAFALERKLHPQPARPLRVVCAACGASPLYGADLVKRSGLLICRGGNHVGN